jgi:hypothetical protein
MSIKENYNRFEMKLYGLSEDMEDFMLEQTDHYEAHPTKFWSSFWKTCVEMWQNSIDLSNKQLSIIYREYNKVKEERISEYRKEAK